MVTADFVKRVHFHGRFAIPNGGGFEQPAHPQPHVIDDARLATDGDHLFDELLVNAGIRLRWIFAGADIVQEQLMESFCHAVRIACRRALRPHRGQTSTEGEHCDHESSHSHRLGDRSGRSQAAIVHCTPRTAPRIIRLTAASREAAFITRRDGGESDRARLVDNG